MNKQLMMAYNVDQWTELENDIKLKKLKISKMTDEKDRLLKTKVKQIKEIDYLDNEGILKNQKTNATPDAPRIAEGL